VAPSKTPQLASGKLEADAEGKPGENNFHILAIRFSAMGDVAMTVPVLSALTHQYPQLRITMLTKPFFKPMFAQLQNVEVFEAKVKDRHKGVFGLWKLYRELRALRIDAAADLHNVVRSKVLKSYFRFGGIPFFQIDKGRAEKKALTSLKNKVFKPLKSTHERYAEVFAALGFPVNLSKAIPLDKEELSKNVSNLAGPDGSLGSDTKLGGQSSPFPDTTNWLGIAPFAAFEGKMYPLHLMEEVIQKLDNTVRYKIFLFGGGKEETQGLEKLETRFKSCTNVAGKLSFAEELALISNLGAMISMDSGNGHLAAMYGVPVITLWGVTHPYAGFYPFGQDADNALVADREKFPLIPTSVYGNKMPEGYEKAMETILPGDVVAKIENILNR
jgi:ADP-heptose:LPS heptosyltransferase